MADGRQVPTCHVSVKKEYPESKIPQHLVVSVSLMSAQTGYRMGVTFTYPFFFELRLKA